MVGYSVSHRMILRQYSSRSFDLFAGDWKFIQYEAKNAKGMSPLVIGRRRSGIADDSQGLETAEALRPLSLRKCTNKMGGTCEIRKIYIA